MSRKKRKRVSLTIILHVWNVVALVVIMLCLRIVQHVVVLHVSKKVKAYVSFVRAM